MNKEELGKLYPITVVPYNLKWTSMFEIEKQRITKEAEKPFNVC